MDSLYVSIDFINVQSFNDIEGFDEHSHSNHEFHYIKSGTGHVFLGAQEFVLSHGSFYLTGPGMLHKQISDKNNPMLEYAMRCSIRFIMKKVSFYSNY